MAEVGGSSFFFLLADSEEELFQRFYAQVVKSGFHIDQNQSHEWHSLIRGMTEGLVRFAERNGRAEAKGFFTVEGLELPEQLAERLVKINSGHGLGFKTVIRLFQFLQQLFRDLLYDSTSSLQDLREIEACLNQFFGQIDIAFANHLLLAEKKSHHRELRQARYDLLHEKRRYFVVFQRLAEPAFVVDSDLKLVDANQAFEKFFDEDIRALLGVGCCKLLGHLICEVCALEDALHRQTSFSNVELTVVVKNLEKTVLMNGTYMGDLENGVPGILVILKDITDKKAIEGALRDSEEKYRSLVENVPDAVWRADQTGRLVFISPNIEKICGYQPGEIMDKGLANSPYIHPEDAERVRQSFAHLFQIAGGCQGEEECPGLKPEKYDLRYRFLHRNGSWIWLYDKSGKVYQRDGNWFVDGVVSDISRLKKVEEELDRHRVNLSQMVDAKTAELVAANQRLLEEIADRVNAEEELTKLALRLKRSNQELEQFAHVASHDLKEPLILIIAFCEKLIQRNYLALDQKGREYIDRIRQAGQKMQMLIDDLLQLSRISRSEVSFEAIDLNSLITEVVDDLEEKVKEVKATIKIGKLHDITADRVQARQLFQNILVNALKFRKENRKPLVQVRSRILDNGWCEITIEDNGIGFDEKYLKRIFNPFERLHGKSKYEGTGIGLATCSSIVLRHGGDITARSTPAKGSVFIVRLPSSSNY